MTTDPDLEAAEATFQAFVRGDALIGLMPDPQRAAREMMAGFWRAAGRGDGAAWERLGEAFFAVLVPIGAFDGVWEDGQPDAWPEDTLFLTDEIAALEGALRCMWRAARAGRPGAAARFARWSRHSPGNQPVALELLRSLPHPTPSERTQTGYVHHWLGDLAAAAASHHAAAEAGDADAMFELHLYAAQGLAGPRDPEAADVWLQRAADREHPRALYNLGASWASGSRGKADPERAAGYYRRAVARGHGRAAATLGVMILTGELPGSPQDAGALLTQAESLGYDPFEMLDLAGLDDPRA